MARWAATGALEADPPDLANTLERQTTAVGELAKALALLVPPEQRQGEEQRDGESQEASGPQEPTEDPDESESMDPAQLLQAVRDREAERRRERSRREQSRYETVEKDW